MLSACARRASLVVDGSCPTTEHCASRRPLSFRARPWRDVPGMFFDAKLAPCAPSAGAPALAVSGKEALHWSLQSVRALLRWLYSVGAL